MIKLITLFTVIISINAYSQDLQWRLISTSPGESPGRIDDIFFINEKTGWTFDLIGSFPNHQWYSFKTSDGGYTWVSTLVGSTAGAFRSIGFADTLNGWIGTLSVGGTNIFKTSDGGQSWLPSLVSNPQDSIGICGISVINKDTVYAAGRYYGPAHFYKTTNGGNNWQVTDLAKYGIHYLIDCHFFNADSGFITGGTGISSSNSKGMVLFTSNAGATWEVKKITNSTGTWGWKISFPTRETGYISLERIGSGARYFLKTTNGGETWQENTFSNTSISVQGIGFINENTGWIGGNYVGSSGNAGYETTDGGETWNPMGYFKHINRIRILNDTLAYASGDRIYKYTRDSTVNINLTSSEIPDKFTLFQNFPNPFNPSTEISFEIPHKNLVKLSVFNSLGQKVAVLVYSNLSAGKYKINFDASNLSAGIYFYKLEYGGNFAVKKMVIVK